jgi:hypothetical protein
VGGTGNANGNGAGGIVLADGERIQGGACACRVASTTRGRALLAGWIMAIGLGLGRLRRRTGRGRAR